MSVKNRLLINIVKPVLKGHLWDKGNVNL